MDPFGFPLFEHVKSSLVHEQDAGNFWIKTWNMATFVSVFIINSQIKMMYTEY